MATALGKSVRKIFANEIFSKPASFNANDKFRFNNFSPKTIFDQEKFFEQLIKDQHTTYISPVVRKIEKFKYDIKAKINLFEFSSIDTLKNIFTTTYSKTVYKLNQFSNKVIYKALMQITDTKLDLVLDKMTYKKLADLINNLSDKQANKLVHHLSFYQLEKVVNLISPDKLDKLFNKNVDTTSLKDVIKQNLAKLSNKNISNEELEDIIILAGEEKLVENFGIIPNENLARIIDIASDDSLEKIITILSNEDLEKVLSTISNDTLLEIIDVISDKNFKKIINIISLEKLAQIIDNTLDVELEKIVNIISDEQLYKVYDLISKEKTEKLSEIILPERVAKIISEYVNSNGSEVNSINDESNIEQQLNIISKIDDDMDTDSAYNSGDEDSNIKLLGGNNPEIQRPFCYGYQYGDIVEV